MLCRQTISNTFVKFLSNIRMHSDVFSSNIRKCRPMGYPLGPKKHTKDPGFVRIRTSSDRTEIFMENIQKQKSYSCSSTYRNLAFFALLWQKSGTTSLRTESFYSQPRTESHFNLSGTLKFVLRFLVCDSA